MLVNSMMEKKLYVVHEMNTSVCSDDFQINFVLSFIFTVAQYILYLQPSSEVSEKVWTV